MGVGNARQPDIRLEYDRDTRRLRVEFVGEGGDGEARTFRRVPRAVYEAFERAPSKGQFFAAHIRDRYPSA